MEKNNFSLLRSKEIIAILDGDKDFDELTFKDKYGNETKIKIAMPYLSGPAICELSSFFGLPATYSWSGGALSRWQYFDNIMAFCIKQNRMSDFLSYLFSKDKFVDVLRDLSVKDIQSAHEATLTGANATLLAYANKKIEDLDNRRKTLSKAIADLSVETLSSQQIELLSGYLDDWENISFEDKRKAADGLISSISATSDYVKIEWKI